jgi:AraC-like DNA-binding protein
MQDGNISADEARRTTPRLPFHAGGGAAFPDYGTFAPNGHLLRELALPSASGPLSPLVRHVIDHFEESYLEPRPLLDIARVLRKSPFQIIRRFRREMRVTPHAYLVALRIAHAIRLLRQGESIAQAAAAAGFSDQSHLTRHFKRWTGMTPGSFRRHRAEALPPS